MTRLISIAVEFKPLKFPTLTTVPQTSLESTYYPHYGLKTVILTLSPYLPARKLLRIKKDSRRLKPRLAFLSAAQATEFLASGIFYECERLSL